MSTKKGGATGSDDGLYKGWMTGYSYQTSRNLYFQSGPLSKLDRAKRRSLLEWLNTYSVLVGDIQPTGYVELGKSIQAMITEVAEAKVEQGLIKEEQFGVWYAGVEGALRAKLPSSFYAAGFASALSRLGHPKSVGDARHAVKHDLRYWLIKLRNGVSKEVYEVIDNDLSKLADRLSEKSLTEIPKDFTKSVRKLREDWGGLVLGLSSPRDLLGNGSRIILWVAVALATVGMGLGISAILALPFITVALVSGVNTGNLSVSVTGLLSNVQASIGILTAVGISLAFLVKKASDGLTAAVSYLTVWLVRRRSLDLLLPEAAPSENTLANSNP